LGYYQGVSKSSLHKSSKECGSVERWECLEALIEPLFCYYLERLSICVATRKDNLKSRYGITEDDYNLMSAKQNNSCAICKQKSEINLSVDHCHKTGIVRGLLCRNCNLALGYLKDDTNRIESAMQYLSESQRKSTTSKTKTDNSMDSLHGVNGGGQARTTISGTCNHSTKSIRRIGTRVDCIGPFVEDIVRDRKNYSPNWSGDRC
jgi:hypothetical protein